MFDETEREPFMFRIPSLSGFTSRGTNLDPDHGSGLTGGRKARKVRPVVEKLETRNLLSHMSPAAASTAHHPAASQLHAASEASSVPSYPYSGLGHIHYLHLSQVPADTGPNLRNPNDSPFKHNYEGIAVKRGSYFPKGERGKLELYGAFLETFSKYDKTNHIYDFVSYAGDEVPPQFQGTVVKVVNNWTPKSHDPNGNYVVVQTVEPDGLVFDIRYSHLLSNIKVKKGEYLSPEFDGYLGQAGHTGVPAGHDTTYSVTLWTPEFGGRYLTYGYYGVLESPETSGTPPNFVDLDPNPDGTSDDPDNDADDPVGFGTGP
jgi:hypothetical protein